MASFYRVNFELADNEDLRQAFALTDSTGLAADLMGSDLRMAIAGLDGAATLGLSLANGRIAILDASLGQFEIAVAASDLRTLPPGIYRHDLLLTLAGRTQRVWEGSLVLTHGVTG